LINSLFLTNQIKNTRWTYILQVKHEYRARDVRPVVENKYFGLFTSGSLVASSGGNFISVSPQINYTMAQKWDVSLLTNLPIFRYYNGVQLGSKYLFALYLSRVFRNKACIKNSKI
jgi:hypothetical protein